MLRTSLLLLALVAPASAQFGRRNIQRDKPQQQGGGAKDMNDVDLAMAGWEQLSKNPGKMQEVMESLKDPEVMAKAQEMLKDPVYMEAARKKVNELQAKAQQRGLIDRNGQPVAGAAAAAAQQMGVEGLAELGAAAAYPNVKAPGQGGGSPGMEAATRDPREWELQNIEKMKQGELNHAELGFANMKAAINDPGMMANVMEMMKDPATMAEVRRPRARLRNSAARNSAARNSAPQFSLSERRARSRPLAGQEADVRPDVQSAGAGDGGEAAVGGRDAGHLADGGRDGRDGRDGRRRRRRARPERRARAAARRECAAEAGPQA